MDQEYVPPPKSEHSGLIVALIAVVALLLLVGLFMIGGWAFVRQSRMLEVERMRAVEAEQRALIQMERAQAEAARAQLEAERGSAVSEGLQGNP